MMKEMKEMREEMKNLQSGTVMFKQSSTIQLPKIQKMDSLK